MTNLTYSGLGTPRLPSSALVLGLAMTLVLTFVASAAAQVRPFKVIYTFSGGEDGAMPQAGLTMDGAGNLYGTTSNGGTAGGGTVFELSPRESGWLFTVLHSFTGGNDGARPAARVVFGRDGALYGTTMNGGSGGGGTVFRMTPPPTLCKTAFCPWVEVVLYSFAGNADGANPGYGDLAFDDAGNIYGTTQAGGGTGTGCPLLYGCGTVFALTRSSGGQWAESVLHRFVDGLDGSTPTAGVIFDKVGNLYGTTLSGGTGDVGTVYQLTPSGSGWIESILVNFPDDGAAPFGGLIFDQAGNLFGATIAGGFGRPCGSVYELTPSGGAWVFTSVYIFSGNDGPFGGLVMDASSNLYGTTFQDGEYLAGSVFKLAPSGGGWTYTDLHDFCFGSCSGGKYPMGTLAPDPAGNLYGTASEGGTGYGVAWEITP